MDADLVFDILRALEREGVRYKIIGGVAMNLVGLPRATRDLDIFVAAEADNVDALRRALRSVFDDPDIDGIVVEDLAGEYPAVQYVPPVEGFHVDILSRLGEAWSYADIEIALVRVEDLEVPVATPSMLFRMKRGTVRLQDRADADRLRRRFGLED